MAAMRAKDHDCATSILWVVGGVKSKKLTRWYSVVDW